MQWCAKFVLFFWYPELQRHWKIVLFNFGRIFIPHFYSQFHNFGYKKFLSCSKGNKEHFIPAKQVSHFISWILITKNRTILWYLNWINLFKFLVLSFGKLCFCCDFTFLFAFGLNSKSKLTKKVKIPAKKHIVPHYNLQNSCINTYVVQPMQFLVVLCNKVNFRVVQISF